MKQSVKTLLAAGTCLASLLTVGPALAATNYHHGRYDNSNNYNNGNYDGTNERNSWYWGLSGDLTWLRHSDTGGGGNVELGYHFNDFRLEGEAGYHSAGGSNGYSGTHYFTYMGNVYYDFNNAFPVFRNWHLLPYIGAGLGDAEVHFGNSNFTNTFHHHNNEFAYQGMVGVHFAMAAMPNTVWSLGYRYLGTDNHNIHANNLELGVRFHF